MPVKGPIWPYIVQLVLVVIYTITVSFGWLMASVANIDTNHIEPPVSIVVQSMPDSIQVMIRHGIWMNNVSVMLT
jgi:hypothetical protein